MDAPRGVIRYWAAARDAAGVAEEAFHGTTLAEALDEARARHADPRFASVLERCSFLVDGAPVGAREPADVPLTADTTVEVLPPFAGG